MTLHPEAGDAGGRGPWRGGGAGEASSALHEADGVFFLGRGGSRSAILQQGWRGSVRAQGWSFFCPCFVKAAGAPVSSCSVGKREVGWGPWFLSAFMLLPVKWGNYSCPPHRARVGSCCETQSVNAELCELFFLAREITLQPHVLSLSLWEMPKQSQRRKSIPHFA